MRASIVHLLVALLIAVFAVGAPLPAQADCAQCQDCTLESPAKNDIPCPQKSLACQAQNCAGQQQKMPAQTTGRVVQHGAKAAFGQASAVAIKLADITPETAPPRV